MQMSGAPRGLLLLVIGAGFWASGCGSSSSSSSEVVNAANTFLGTLSSSQKTSVNLSLTAANAETWSNLPVPMATRNGIAFSDMTSAQSDAALALVKTAMGTVGSAFFTAVRIADDKLATINSSNWGSGKYYVAILGTPSTTSAWILQIGGHHTGFNLTYNGTTTSGTPMFMGVDPPSWTDSSGTYSPLETQRAAVAALYASVSGASNIGLSGMFDDVVMGPNGTGNHDVNFPKSYPTSNRGAAVSGMSSSQKALIKTAIEAWVNTIPSSAASAYLSAYESDDALNNTFIAVGSPGMSNPIDFSANPANNNGKGSYLRIDGPRVWIEFVVQVGAYNPSLVHYHTLWRDKQNDYGAEF